MLGVGAERGAALHESGRPQRRGGVGRTLVSVVGRLQVGGLASPSLSPGKGRLRAAAERHCRRTPAAGPKSELRATRLSPYGPSAVEVCVRARVCVCVLGVCKEGRPLLPGLVGGGAGVCVSVCARWCAQGMAGRSFAGMLLELSLLIEITWDSFDWKIWFDWTVGAR